MGKSLYLEASSGIAGDMFVAALLDLGADRKALDRAVSSIPAKGFTVEIGRVQKAGIDCCDFNVILDRDHENHDHDMAYLYGPLPEVREEVHEEHHCHCHEEEHDHGEGHHCHCHEDDHGEEHHCHCHEEEHHHEEGHHHHHGEGHHHEHRHLKDVEAVIDGTDMTESARALAKKIFRIVAEAESKAHNLPIEEVHFHEVGAIDSIVDIISAAVCFDSLNITNVIVPKLSEGTGTVRCQHGVLPVPVPATLNIVTAYHMPLEIMDAKGEYVTPTGAAIAAALATSHSLPAYFTILKTGLGAGKRDYKERTNILRAILIDDGGGDWEKDEVVKLESDIDDASGEVLGYTMKKLMDAGALDVHFSPIYMKKNRPAFELTVICKEEKKKEMEEIIFRETTTIGIREFSSLMRSILHREEKEVDTSFGPVKVKEVTLGSEKRRYPEYESVKKLAEEKHVPFQTIFDEVKRQ
nr:nickel pincer cofactor biosynthesis protein LarC [uncultured Dialister sp.]